MGHQTKSKNGYAPVSINIALPVGRIGRGSGVITIECLRKGDERYRVVVADDGAGLPQGVVWSVLEKIGALMVQTPRENTKTDLDVESAPGKGVRVTMSFDHKPLARKTN